MCLDSVTSHMSCMYCCLWVRGSGVRSPDSPFDVSLSKALNPELLPVAVYKWPSLFVSRN